MGASNVTAEKEAEDGKDTFTSLLKDVALIVQAPTCSDLLAYRITVRPILDKLIGPTREISTFIVDREHLFHQAISFYKNVSKNKHIQLMITFRTDGRMEEGLDGSGLRREFYTTFFRECLLGGRNLFVGEGRRKVPSNDMAFLQSGCFSAIGRAIVASILNGDCGFPYLAPCVFFYLIGEDCTTHLQLEDVPDLDIKQLCQQLLKARSDAEIIELLDSKEASIIDHIGWPLGQSITVKTRDTLVQQITRWSLLDKRKQSLDQLKEGLQHMGFLEAMKKQPTLLALLVYSPEYSISAKYIQKKFLPRIEELQPKDEKQEHAKEFAIECIRTLTNEEARWLFQYVTGALDPPVEEEPISVEFNTFKSDLKFPEASTCSSKLWIPQGNKTLEEFKQSFRTALELFREGFGADAAVHKG